MRLRFCGVLLASQRVNARTSRIIIGRSFNRSIGSFDQSKFNALSIYFFMFRLVSRGQSFRSQWFSSLLLLLGSLCVAAAQTVDLNFNGMSDVWEQIYAATGLDPNADADGDGVPNGVESLAGTSPFDANSFPHITTFGNSNSVFNVTMPCAQGTGTNYRASPISVAPTGRNQATLLANQIQPFRSREPRLPRPNFFASPSTTWIRTMTA